MHAFQVAELLAIGAILSAVLRFMHHSLCAAEEGFASLFVTVDRTSLGWPRGVQESDAPWAWARSQPLAPETPAGTPEDGTGHGDGGRWTDVPPARGGLVVPVDRVRPIHLGVRTT